MGTGSWDGQAVG